MLCKKYLRNTIKSMMAGTMITTPIQTFFRVVLPISAPDLLATFLINFVFNWNNFIIPLFMLTKTEMKVATVGLFDFQHALEGNQDELLLLLASSS